MKYVFLLLFTLTGFSAMAQPKINDEADDYLSPEFHAGRRDALRQLMPANSVTVIFAYPERKYSNDVDYEYHPNPDLYYFTGYTEPNALLLIFKETQGSGDTAYRELFFVQSRNPQSEQWTGKRLGKDGVKEKLKIPNAYTGEEFRNIGINFAQFSKIILSELPTDLDPEKNVRGSLGWLFSQFKEKAGYSASDRQRFDQRSYRQFTGRLREIKQPEEMVLLRKAIDISCIGQNEGMKAVHPGMSEREIQGLHEFVHKKYGAEHWGYPSIVGAGNNGCVLHYISNSKLNIANQMVLIDIGAEYHGYTADVTRTIPANGKFTPEQKQIYNLVYEAQEAAMKMCKEGASMGAMNQKATEVLAKGLMELGIIKKAGEVYAYYPHGLSHHLGLDVHDRNGGGSLKKGMVITIEPGLYIPEGSPCDKKWWGMAVRIEDDVLVRENDCELLSNLAPRKADEVERMISQKSALDDFKLPPLEKKRGF